MATCPYSQLKITNGTVSVNFIKNVAAGFFLREWEPAQAPLKGGGVFSDSPLAHGRRLRMRKRQNAAEKWTVDIVQWDADTLIDDTRKLRQLLEQAMDYGGWSDTEVWIEAQGLNETNVRYSLLILGVAPSDGNPYGDDFWQQVERAAFPDFEIHLERDPEWSANPPGTGQCVEASGIQENWEYEAWTVNSAQPGGQVYDIIELQTGAAVGRLLAADSVSHNIWRTDDCGATAWVASTTDPTTPRCLVEDTSNSHVFVTGGGGCFRSVDQGINWVLRNAGITGDMHSLDYRSQDGYLYVADGSVSRSNDGGAVWGVVLANVTATCILCATDGSIYASGLVAALYPAIWRSTDGVTWERVFQGGYSILGAQFVGIFEPGDGYYYACTIGGHLFKSADGVDWGLVYDFPGTPDIFDLIQYSVDDLLYMSTVAPAVYKGRGGSDWKLETTVPAIPRSIVECSGNNRLFVGGNGNIYINGAMVDVGRTATCDDEVFVTNRSNIAQLTHVFVYNAAPVSWTPQYPAAAFPFDLYPAGPAVGDILYFCIETAGIDTGPFCNLVFDIGTPMNATGWAVTWQYINNAVGPAWGNLNVHDETAQFAVAGVNSVHWVPPSDWVIGAVNGFTGWWVRANLTAFAGLIDVATQDNRDIYTVNWANVNTLAAQIPGDVPALLRVEPHNRSDEDGYDTNIDELDLFGNRAIIGIRSRGDQFESFLNCADEQNPIGVTVALGANTAFGDDVTAPTGRRAVHTTDGASLWQDEVVFSFGPSIATDFYGAFHSYVRAQQVDRDTEQGEVKVRLQVRTGSGGITFITDPVVPPNLNPWQLLDLKSIDLPASTKLRTDELADVTQIAIQVWSSIADLTVYFWDLNLTPTDEWAIDASDFALESDSGITNGRLLSVDSVTYPKEDIRALVRTADASEFVVSSYVENTPEPAILQCNADQRLFFLFARACVTGAHTGADNQPVLTDANASFLTSGVAPGQTIFNITGGTNGIITAVTATTVTALRAGGVAFDWDTTETYLIVCPNWRSEPWVDHSVQLIVNPRYLMSRGAG